ncbi:MAG: ribosome recycling factor [Epsilonproteobacteria bacterium]|nr:ribosome recycling factor [Campylobacterota bacterium]
MLNEIYEDTEEHMQKSIEALKRDFSTLRTGKVSTNILDHIRVDYYGNPTPLNQVANVLAVDATTISITPWEKHMVSQIEKAIQSANIGVNPNSDGDSVKLFFPPMTMEQREEIAKQAKAMAEKAKVAVRNIRKESNRDIKELEKAKEVSEDEGKRAHDRIQKITDSFIAKVDDILAKKQADILKV